MKSIVIYFSHSGNTQKIAEAIHLGMSRLSEQCDIVRIKDLDVKELVKYDLIGLGSAVNHYKEPPNVTNLIEGQMEFLEGKHAFAFCTHGTIPGNFFGRIVPALTQRGLTVIGWNDWYGSVFIPDIPKPYFTDGHPDEIDLKEAEEFGREMVERSRRISEGETVLIPVLPKGREYDELYGRGVIPRVKEISASWTFQFKINKDKCKYPQCTICADNCPMDSIDLSKSPPLFMMTCYRCWFCEQVCPTGAIEIDWEPLVKAHNPHARTHLAKAAREAEAKGRFRPLVSYDDIGWETPWYKITQHPRLKPLSKSSKNR